jgi:site-specific recombinase XerD
VYPAVIYWAGLRIGELINLQVAGIDKDQRLIHVKGGKGKKDRMSLLSGKNPGIFRTVSVTVFAQEMAV